MDENPYEPPKELNSRRTARSGVMIWLLVVASLPAAFFCGGITCYSVGAGGELSARAFGYEQNAYLRELGWTLGIPIGLVVIVLVPILVVWIDRRRRS